MSTPSESIQKQIQEALLKNEFKDLIDKVSTYKVMTEENKITLAKDLSDGLGEILNKNNPSTATAAKTAAAKTAAAKTDTTADTTDTTDAQGAKTETQRPI